MERTFSSLTCSSISFFLAIGVLQIPCCASSQSHLFCTAASPSCSSACVTADSCTCSEEYSRCICSDKAAALLQDGRCITTASGRRNQSGQDQFLCSQDDLLVSVLLYAGANPSPEVQAAHLIEGHPSPALTSILHWSTARAMGLDSAKISVFDVKISSTLTNDTSPEELPSTFFFDVSFSVCASTSNDLGHGAVFERGFIQSWQDFAAFPITSVRVLELKESRAPKEKSVQSYPWSSTSLPLVQQEQEQQGDHLWQDLLDQLEDIFWLWPVVGVCCIILCVTSCRLLQVKCSKRAPNSQEQWRDVAPGAHLQRDQFEARSVFEGPGSGTVAVVAHDFDPNSKDGMAFATSGCLEASECLTVAKDDFVEIFARGEGWLYGRRSGDGTFGYIPEPFVCWLQAETETVAIDIVPDEMHMAATNL